MGRIATSDGAAPGPSAGTPNGSDAITSGTGPPSRRRHPPRAHRVRDIAFSCIATILVLGGLELGLRVLFPVVRTATLPETMIRDHLSARGLRYDPDLYWYWEMLPSNAMQINEYGFRRLEPMTAQKPDGVTRVVTLGDSQTLGAGVRADESYSAFAEDALGPGWEILDAGISGYRSLNVYRLLQRRILYFQPDIVVIDCMPFDSPRDDGPLQGAPLRTPTQRLSALLWESTTYHAMQLAIGKFRPDRGRWLDQTAGELSRNEKEPGNHDLILEWGRQNGVQVVFMEYAVRDDHTNALTCHTREGELPPGAPVVPTCKELGARNKPATELFMDRNHLSVEGNRQVGQILAATLRSLHRT